MKTVCVFSLVVLFVSVFYTPACSQAPPPATYQQMVFDPQQPSQQPQQPPQQPQQPPQYNPPPQQYDVPAQQYDPPVAPPPQQQQQPAAFVEPQFGILRQLQMGQLGARAPFRNTANQNSFFNNPLFMLLLSGGDFF
ncbi:hypothetical protein SNE40_023184 [Patella caerulea]|uniref:Uncharacterized protein n=1 Tax=Patella caerulea TaxID=87958 RepID=A0AAN8IWQ4_PATCE